MPDRASPVIRVATPADVPALMTLESHYFIGNLPPESRDNGFISIQHPAEWFAAAVASAGIHVAEVAGKLGAEALATFVVSGRNYHFLAYAF